MLRLSYFCFFLFPLCVVFARLFPFGCVYYFCVLYSNATRGDRREVVRMYPPFLLFCWVLYMASFSILNPWSRCIAIFNSFRRGIAIINSWLPRTPSGVVEPVETTRPLNINECFLRAPMDWRGLRLSVCALRFIGGFAIDYLWLA